MKNEDLENTLPIQVVTNDEAMSREQKNIDKQLEAEKEAVEESREEKFRNLEETKEDVDTEEAEEALAEKNIAMAEDLLKEENDLVNENEKKAKKNLIEKFKSLPKKTKIIIITSAVVVLILILTLVILLVTKKDKVDENTKEPDNQVEEAPVIVDNYYYQKGVLHFLGENEKEIGTYECNNKDENLCYVSFNKYRDDFDTDILLNENNKENIGRIPIYNEDFVFINDTDNESVQNIILYSLKKNAVEDRFTDAKAFDDNYVIVSDTKKNYGLLLIEDTIKELISPKYEYLGMIDKENNLVSKTSRGYTIINKNGQELSKTIASNNIIKYYSNDLIVTTLNDEYNVYNYNGDLLANSYNFATVKEGYMALVKDNKLYIRDKNKQKYNENGINLKNNNYVRQYVYDDKNRLTKTKVSFTLNVRESDLEITVYDASNENPIYTRLELATSVINKQYKYLNYLENKLYFYKDEAKEELVGSYTCTNKNTVEQGVNVLDNCLPAKDTIFENNETTTTLEKERKTTIPIINNRFVFIADGAKNINFYDLIDNKNLGTYEAVNTYLPDNAYNFIPYSGNVTFVALNKKGKYGIISIEGSKATTKNTFIYNHLEKMGTNYLAQDEENKWLLIYNENTTSATFDQKIAEVYEKKYFKIGQNDKYQIYSSNGEKITNDTYKKAKLYQNYYGAISLSNELSVYDYKGKKLTEGIKVNDLSCNKPELFRIESIGTKYKVSICNKDEYEVYTPSLVNEQKEPVKEPEKDPEPDETEKKDPEKETEEDKKQEEQPKKEE